MFKDKLTKYDIFLFNHEKEIHSLRIATAFVMCFLIFKRFNIQSHSWPLISLVVVLMPTSFIGNVFNRAKHRIAGTFFGVLFGLSAMMVAEFNFISSIIFLFFCFLFIGWFSFTKYQYVAILIGITMSIICSANPGNYTVALWRGLDISIGSVSAILISLTFPQRAEVHWRLRYNKIFMNIMQSIAYTVSKNTLKDYKQLLRMTSNIRTTLELNERLYPALSKELQVPIAQLKKIDHHILEVIINIEFTFKILWIQSDLNNTLTNINNNTEFNNHLISLFKYTSDCFIRPDNIQKSFSLLKKMKSTDCIINKKNSLTFVSQSWFKESTIDLIEALDIYMSSVTDKK